MDSVQQARPGCAIVWSNLFLLLAKAGVWATLAFVDLGKHRCAHDPHLLSLLLLDRIVPHVGQAQGGQADRHQVQPGLGPGPDGLSQGAVGAVGERKSRARDVAQVRGPEEAEGEHFEVYEENLARLSAWSF